ncbi:MAG: hypothetical protein AB7T10_08450 [bacterium]
MDNFKTKLVEAEKTENVEERINLLIDIFQEVKYKHGAEAVIILLKLAPLFEDQFVVFYHLFNHFLMMNVNDEAEKIIEPLMREGKRIREMSLKYPLQTEFAETLVFYFENSEEDKARQFLSDSSKRDKSALGAKYFELSMKLRDAGIENISDSYFKSAISNSDGKAKSKMVLSYCQTLEKRGMKQKAKTILSSEINNSNDTDSLPLMYKLAVMTEEEDAGRALEIYREIERIDFDFLDIKEKISKLTNDKNRYKIDKLSEESLKDDSNIHF